MQFSPPRVAFFTDCFHEINGVALTSRQLHAFALRRELPFFSLHVGPETCGSAEGTVTTLELKRSPLSFPLDAGMYFDLLGLRHLGRVRRALRRFRPDLIHITGPGDCGILGAVLARQLRVPLVASWHTNLHEYAGRRLEGMLGFLPAAWRRRVAAFAEGRTLDATLLFYNLAGVFLAPNPELIRMLEERTHKPVFLMQRGVDTTLFSPDKRERGSSAPFTIGYVGRLSTEKNVQLLAETERALVAAGYSGFRFLIVGQGSQRDWLRQNMQTAEFTGILKGEPLARAYASMDVFAFPSSTDTFGNVVTEALASGVPTVVTGGGGPKFLVRDGETGFVAADSAAFVRAIASLIANSGMHRSMSRAARAYALGLSWDSIFEDVYRAYHLALSLQIQFSAGGEYAW